jgi:hypothetical protein
LNVDEAERKRVCERNQFVRSLCGLDPSDSSCGQDVPLRSISTLDGRSRLGRHPYYRTSTSTTLAFPLPANIDHASVATRIDVTERLFGHADTVPVAAKTPLAHCILRMGEGLSSLNDRPMFNPARIR